jgi:hypothetical protein
MPFPALYFDTLQGEKETFFFRSFIFITFMVRTKKQVVDLLAKNKANDQQNGISSEQFFFIYTYN